MYHAVAPVQGRFSRLGVPADVLDRHLAALVGAGYRIVGLSEALELVTKSDDARVVALTFDDAYEDFLGSLPVLARWDARATLYVPTAFVGGSASWLGRHASAFSRLLDWDQLESLVVGGRVEIGSHGRQHRQLDIASPQEVRDDVEGSRRDLESRLGCDVVSFCYPHGYHTATVRTAVERAGYHNACEVGRRVSGVGDRFAVSRLEVTPDWSSDRLLAEVSSSRVSVRSRLTRAAMPGWRLARRSRRGVARA
jgi:peptidoglycan/xylan/chitin deacetylase (PgdA/CDA1 family)